MKRSAIAFGPRRPNRRADDPDVSADEDGVEGGGEFAVSVANQETELSGAVAEAHEQVCGQLSSIGGRPVRWGQVHRRRTRRRCQQRIVPWVTRRWHRSARGNRRTSAAKIARSAQSRRARGWVRRRTATSWRSTRSSMSLVAHLRPSSTSPSTCGKIKYSNRSDTPGSCLASDPRWSATRALLLAPHSPRRQPPLG
jgi:hypothetical protein